MVHQVPVGQTGPCSRCDGDRFTRSHRELGEGAVDGTVDDVTLGTVDIDVAQALRQRVDDPHIRGGARPGVGHPKSPRGGLTRGKTLGALLEDRYVRTLRDRGLHLVGFIGEGLVGKRATGELRRRRVDHLAPGCGVLHAHPEAEGRGRARVEASATRGTRSITHPGDDLFPGEFHLVIGDGIGLVARPRSACHTKRVRDVARPRGNRIGHNCVNRWILTHIGQIHGVFEYIADTGLALRTGEIGDRFRAIEVRGVQIDLGRQHRGVIDIAHGGEPGRCTRGPIGNDARSIDHLRVEGHVVGVCGCPVRPQ